MTRRPQVRTGTTGGCLLNGCLALLVLALVTVVGTWIRLATQPERDEVEARADLRENVEAGRGRLARAAADGGLEDAEIARIFPPTKPVGGLVDIRRQGESITVVAGLQGFGPPRAFILVTQVSAEGCYAFHVPSLLSLSPSPARGVPRVSVRELSDETCGLASASKSTPTKSAEVPARGSGTSSTGYLGPHDPR